MDTSKTGVYRIRYLESGKSYIGSAAQAFRTRWNSHKSKLARGIHHSQPLQMAWDKYGADAFVFEILLYCDSENCLMYEQLALDCYRPYYNVQQVAGSSIGRVCKESTRRKISDNNKGKHVGELNSSAKLSIKQVKNIKLALALGESQNDIATRFSMSKQTISAIKHGHIWRSV